MNTVRLVEKMATIVGVELTPRQLRRFVRSYKLDKLECGKQTARRLLRLALEVMISETDCD